MQVNLYDEHGRIASMRFEKGNTLPGHSGYRMGNKFILSPSTFNDFHHAHMMNNFERIRQIVNGCIDLLDPKLQNREIIQKQLRGI